MNENERAQFDPPGRRPRRVVFTLRDETGISLLRMIPIIILIIYFLKTCLVAPDLDSGKMGKLWPEGARVPR